MDRWDNSMMVKARGNSSRRVYRIMDSSSRWGALMRGYSRLSRGARSKLRRSGLLTSQISPFEFWSRRLHHANIRRDRVRDKRGETREWTKKRGIFIDFRWDIGQRFNYFFIGHWRDDGLRVGLRLRFVICQLVDGDNISILRKSHLTVNHIWDSRNCISLAMTQ